MLIKETVQTDRSEGSGAGSRSGRPPARYGRVSLNEAFVPARLGKGSGGGQRGKPPLRSLGPGLSVPHFALDEAQGTLYGLVR